MSDEWDDDSPEPDFEGIADRLEYLSGLSPEWWVERDFDLSAQAVLDAAGPVVGQAAAEVDDSAGGNLIADLLDATATVLSFFRLYHSPGDDLDAVVLRLMDDLHSTGARIRKKVDPEAWIASRH